jgi:class 3 adenylate cyclase
VRRPTGAGSTRGRGSQDRHHVFSDLKGSTSLGERLDTESLREVLNVYFREMQTVLERHGGTVEKFIGDAIVAVFGLPTLHEDDALRAVRAAFEMNQTLARVNDKLEAGWGVRLENRTGVNTGEVWLETSAPDSAWSPATRSTRRRVWSRLLRRWRS